jgi:hypothetical protein
VQYIHNISYISNRITQKQKTYIADRYHLPTNQRHLHSKVTNIRLHVMYKCTEDSFDAQKSKRLTAELFVLAAQV